MQIAPELASKPHVANNLLIDRAASAEGVLLVEGLQKSYGNR
jgi:hypothetical protein